MVGSHPGHGTFHPAAWRGYYDGAKAWVMTLGHDAGVFATDGSFPGAAEFRTMIAGGIRSVKWSGALLPMRSTLRSCAGLIFAGSTEG